MIGEYTEKQKRIDIDSLVRNYGEQYRPQIDEIFRGVVSDLEKDANDGNRQYVAAIATNIARRKIDKIIEE